MSIFAGVRGFLDGVEVNDVTRFEQGLLSDVKNNGADILDSIRDEGSLSEETDKKLSEFVESYAKNFA